MMNKAVLILFFLISFRAFCNNPKDEIHSLDKYVVVNPNIFPALDSIITMKNGIPYYTYTGLFTIEFDQDSLLTDLIYIEWQKNQIHSYFSDILGYFNYRGHTFVIRGDSIDTSIFKKTDKYRNFIFGVPPIQYTDKGEPIIPIGAFAVWSIRYKDSHFKILSFFTNNKKDPWFDHIKEEYNIENYP
ncbi:hypothetical protein [Coprobacter sp.]